MEAVELARIATLLQPYANLDLEQAGSISKYIDLISKSSRKINLTAIRDPEEMVTRHFGESFFAAAQWLAPERRETVIDIGSGAGFPGVPLAMYSPSTTVTLVESQSKKTAFLNEVIYTLELINASVFNGRAEQIRSKGDLITFRAVEKFGKVLPVAGGLVRPGGKLGLMIGASQVQSAVSLLKGFAWAQPLYVPGGQARVLLGGTKMLKVD